jgi:hypothetical protein
VDSRKPVADALECGEKHGRDLRKVNDSLRELVESLRSGMERASCKPRNGAAPDAPASAEPQPDTGSPIDLENRRLAAELAQALEAVRHAECERQSLLTRLAEIEAENQRVCDEFVRVQERNTELAQLHVALERIHGGASRAETLAAVQDLVINLVGSEELAVLERRGEELVVVQSFGVDPARLHGVKLGCGAIGRTAATGTPYVAGNGAPAGPEEGDVTACIPLRVGADTTGVIAIFRLLGHKPGLHEGDHAILDLLSAHVGVALRLRDAGAEAGRA